MTDDIIDREIAWLDEKLAEIENGAIPTIEDFKRLRDFAKTMRKERDIYRSTVENVQKQMDRFRDHASYTYIDTIIDDDEI